MVGGILLKEKQARIILLLKNSQQAWYLSTLSKAADTTYVHTSNFIKACERMGITTNEKHGKIKEIKLTEKGVKLADALGSIHTIINQTPPTQQKAEEKAEVRPEEKRDDKKG